MENSRNGIHTNVPQLTWRIWLCYGIGHVLNDICASIWFTYLLVFFHVVLKFDRINAGLLLLIGQIADGLSTSFVGIECDKSESLAFLNYGKRKTWHLVGTICILLSFPFIFTPCLSCRSAHVSAQMVYYSAFVIIFQFGWAAVQISHLALIPELTPSDHQRTQLTSVRYSFTVASTILIYIVTWVSLKSGRDGNDLDEIGPDDAITFQRVVYIGLLMGLITSAVFHWGIKEGSAMSCGIKKRSPKSVTQFLKDVNFYQVALTYMSSRLFVNIAQVYVPLYVHEAPSNKAENMALVPLLMFTGSIAASGAVNHLNRFLGRKVAFFVGSAIGIAACTWIELGNDSSFEIFPVSVLMGICGSVSVVTALGLTADLIGFDTDAGAFVYGAMSFFDKVANGVAVMIIQYAHGSSCSHFYRRVIAYACGGAAALGLLSVACLRLPSGNRTAAGPGTSADPVDNPDDGLDERKPLLANA